ALDVVAIGLYVGVGIARRSNQIQTVFVAVWTLATLGIVLVYMKRIRQLRDAAIGRRRPTRPRSDRNRPLCTRVGARHAPRDGARTCDRARNQRQEASAMRNL